MQNTQSLAIGPLSRQEQSVQVQMNGPYNPVRLYRMFAIILWQTTAVMVEVWDKGS